MKLFEEGVQLRVIARNTWNRPKAKLKFAQEAGGEMVAEPFNPEAEEES